MMLDMLSFSMIIKLRGSVNSVTLQSYWSDSIDRIDQSDKFMPSCDRSHL